MKGKLIVLEGIDGSGKATQTGLLEKYLKQQGRQVMHVSFPDYESSSSALVKMYLHGDFGSHPSDVNPYTASLFFAVDRFASYRMKWKEFYENGGIVLADRYTTSNMAHQMTKFDHPQEKQSFLQWLDDLEYGKMGIPRPDLVILLDVPAEISEELIKKRALAGGSMDIHERDENYLKKCHEAYHVLQQFYHWKLIPCTENHHMRSPEDIDSDVKNCIDEFLKQEMK